MLALLRCVPKVNLRSLHNIVRYRKQTVHCSACLFQNQDIDQPVKFSTSKAARMKPSTMYASPETDVPIYQKPIIIISMAVFFIYFCILREENDLDDRFDMFKTVPWLEESELRRQIRDQKEKGISTTLLEKRLAEVLEIQGKSK